MGSQQLRMKLMKSRGTYRDDLERFCFGVGLAVFKGVRHLCWTSTGRCLARRGGDGIKDCIYAIDSACVPQIRKEKQRCKIRHHDILGGDWNVTERILLILALYIRMLQAT